MELARLLAAADAAWDDRLALGYDAAARPLLEAFAAAPDDPDVQWRLARWRLAEGLATDDPALARSSFAEARAVAVGCVERDPGFAARKARGGWVSALTGLEPERVPCAAWGALAWSRWLERHGPEAASLDLPAIDALVDAGHAADDPAVRGIADWAGGLVDAIRPEWAGRDLVAAKTQLQQAIGAEPTDLSRQVDLYLWITVPAGTDQERDALQKRILGLPVHSPEDERARIRAQ